MSLRTFRQNHQTLCSNLLFAGGVASFLAGAQLCKYGAHDTARQTAYMATMAMQNGTPMDEAVSRTANYIAPANFIWWNRPTGSGNPAGIYKSSAGLALMFVPLVYSLATKHRK